MLSHSMAKHHLKDLYLQYYFKTSGASEVQANRLWDLLACMCERCFSSSKGYHSHCEKSFGPDWLPRTKGSSAKPGTEWGMPAHRVKHA